MPNDFLVSQFLKNTSNNKNPQQEAKSYWVRFEISHFEEKICASEKNVNHFPQGFPAKIYTP